MASRPRHPASAAAHRRRDPADGGIDSAIGRGESAAERRRAVSARRRSGASRTSWTRTRRRTSMKALIIGLALIAFMAAPSIVAAHEGHAHKVMGTISSVEGNHIMVKGTDGKE